MNNLELSEVVDKLCGKFSQLASKLEQIKKGKANLESEIRSKKEENNRYQKTMEDKIQNLMSSIEEKESIVRDLEEKKSLNKIKSQSAKESKSKEEALLIEKHKLKERLTNLRADNRARALKLQEEEKEIEKLKSNEQSLISENTTLTEQITKLESQLSGMESRIQTDLYKNTREIEAVKSTKQDYRKMLGRTIEFRSKIKQIEKEIEKESSTIEGKKERLLTLKKLNKILHKKKAERDSLEVRYAELSEESMNLQFLIGEAMKKLAVHYGVKEEDLAPGYEPEIDAIIANQNSYIDELKSVIEQRKEQLKTMKESTKKLEMR